jgi:hypothetical protein
VTVTSNINIAPDGTQTAQLLVPNTTSGVHQIYQATATLVGNTSFTWSCFAKAGGQRYLNLQANYAGAAAVLNVNFDLQTGTAGTITATNFSSSSPNITPLGNGWYRCSITGVVNGAYSGGLYVSVNNSLTGVPASFAGDGFNGIYVWGTQFEQGPAFVSSSLTSYIKTTTATVTRAADYPSVNATNFSTFFNISQGTWYVEAQGGGYESANFYASTVLEINSASASLQHLTAQYSSTTSFLYGTNNIVSLAPTTNTTVNNIGVVNKQAFTYSNTNLTISALGVTPLSSATNNAVPTATNMTIGYSSSNGGWLNGHIKKLAYYPTAMSSANLQALTGN